MKNKRKKHLRNRMLAAILLIAVIGSAAAYAEDREEPAAEAELPPPGCREEAGPLTEEDPETETPVEEDPKKEITEEGSGTAPAETTESEETGPVNVPERLPVTPDPEETREGPQAPGSACDRITVRINGKGSVFLRDGRYQYMPDNGYELVEIKADRAVGEHAAGQEIPETELAEASVPAGTTLTFVFRERTDTDFGENDREDPAGVLFDGVWDPVTGTIH